MKKQLYLNTFTIKILSEDNPLYDLLLADMWNIVNEGDCVLHSMNLNVEEVNKSQMIKLLKQAGSEAEFFKLN